MIESISIILPARNEEAGLRAVLPKLVERFGEHEIIVVDDGSDDATEAVCREHGVRVVRHAYPMGNGASIKHGAREARGEVLLFMDADGQHDPGHIPLLLEQIEAGYDMVVAARHARSQAGVGRLCANALYNWLASNMVAQRVHDLTSGFRAVRAEKFREFMHLYPNGFSCPTTSTMAFFRAAYAVRYVFVPVARRSGRSHIRPLRDGVRFFLIIFKVATLYSPLKLFFPLSMTLLTLGLSYYGYTFWSEGRFTNMSALLLTTSLLIFLIGLVSEQITTLIYAIARRHGG